MRTVVRSTDSMGGQGSRLIDLRSRRRSPLPDECETAWQQIAGATAAKVSHGPLFWGNLYVERNWASKTKMWPGGVPESVTYPAITGYAWLYVTFDLANADTDDSVSCAFLENSDTPITDDSPGFILRRLLSLWKITTTTVGEVTTTVGYKVFTMPSPFPGNLVAVQAPPKAAT